MILQADITKAEARAGELQQQLGASEGRISSQAAELGALQQQLEGLQGELAKVQQTVTDKNNKVRQAGEGERIDGAWWFGCTVTCL